LPKSAAAIISTIKEDRSERVVFPIHGNQTLKIGLQKALIEIIPVAENEL
jgi:predicted RNA binding protein YcfA (HicA-like mRNA interferase family)